MTVFPFTPSASAPFVFQPTLDGETYSGIVTWGLFGQRPYLTISDLAGNVIVSEAMISSPVGQAIEAASWANGSVTITTPVPHGYQVGATVALTIFGMTPAAYNGTFGVFVTGPDTLSYPLASDPGPATALGAVSYVINLVGPYFSTSSLAYYDAARQIVVNP